MELKIFRNILLIITLLFCIQLNAIPGNEVTFMVSTHDTLLLPARFIKGDADQKTLLFINGSTPYDEKGNLGAIWNDQGKIIMEKHPFYLRFMEVMAHKGYSIATMAKRSFVYPTRLPRPAFSDLARDIKSFIDALLLKRLIKDEKDLVIVGYSEGTIVASKVLSILKKKPHACILLGSASSKCDCTNQNIDTYRETEVLRRLKNYTDEQIRTEINKKCEIQKTLLTINEPEFERNFKNSAGFAMWESLYIDREASFYDPLHDLVLANVPILICSGEDDMAMPMVSAKNTYERLKEKSNQQISFKVIEKEAHQYKKYDVFPIMDQWLRTNFRTTEFTLQKTDSLLIEEFTKANELINEIMAMRTANPDKASECFSKATNTKLSDAMAWFKLGLTLFESGKSEEAFSAFEHATDTTFAVHYASLAWLGHLCDLKNSRNDAVAFYKKALSAYPGFPVQHDQWNIVLDTKWLENRITSPFKGVNP